MGAAVESVQCRSEVARLYLGELGAPVVTNVTHRRARGMTVARALPILRLDSAVRDEDGRRGRIASVSVEVEDDTPRIVLDLEYEDSPEDRLPVERTLRLFSVQSGRLASRRDPTLPWGAAAASVLVEATLPPRRDEAVPLPTELQATPSLVVEPTRTEWRHDEPTLIIPARAGQSIRTWRPSRSSVGASIVGWLRPALGIMRRTAEALLVSAQRLVVALLRVTAPDRQIE